MKRSWFPGGDISSLILHPSITYFCCPAEILRPPDICFQRYVSFQRLFFTRKLKEEFGLLPYSLLRTVVPWEPLDTCKSNVWTLCMHRWFVQIICHEFRVSWMSLRMHIRLQQCCRSEMAWNSQTHCTRPLRLTYHTSAQEVLNVYTDPYYSFLNLSVMISSSFSLLSSCSLCFHIVSFPHLCSPLSSMHLGMTLISEWCKETPRCSRLPTFYTEENNKQKKKFIQEIHLA